MARVITKLKEINADMWCTFLGGNGLNSSYFVCVIGELNEYNDSVRKT